MIRVPLRSSDRSAFTMIELMVVILIIAILVTLIASVAVRSMDKIREMETRSEITEMEVALRAFMSDYGLTEPPPSYLALNEVNPLNTMAQDNNQSAAFLEKLFGKNLGNTDWNGDGIIGGGTVLQGEECLVFYLGGIPNSAAVMHGSPPNPQGFAANNMNPGLSLAQCPKRKGPYYQFKTSRLWPQPQQVAPGWDGLFTYIDPWMSKSGVYYQVGSPYAFFSSAGIKNAYAHTPSIAKSPYMTGPGQYTNPDTYQIISAGRDGNFGGPLWIPSAGATGVGADDQANFSSTLLGAGQN